MTKTVLLNQSGSGGINNPIHIVSTTDELVYLILIIKKRDILWLGDENYYTGV